MERRSKSQKYHKTKRRAIRFDHSTPTTMLLHSAWKRNNGLKAKDSSQQTTNLFTHLLMILMKKRKRLRLGPKHKIKVRTFCLSLRWLMTPSLIEVGMFLQPKAIEASEAMMATIINTSTPIQSWVVPHLRASKFCLLRHIKKILILLDGLWVKS